MLFGPFNQKYFESLEGHEKVLSPNDRVIYYTIFSDLVKAGIVGYFIPFFPKKSGFIQILIDPRFRGRGLAKQAISELVKKDNLEVLFVTIEKANYSSLKLFLGMGFRVVSNRRMSDLRKKGLLKKNELRLIKFCLEGR